MMLRRGSATRLTVYLHADAAWGHHSMSDEIIRRAHTDGLAGASRFEGFVGYGRRSVIHTDIDPEIAENLPCAVEIIDPSEERLRAFLSRIDEILDHGLVTLESTEIVSLFSEAATEGAGS